MVQCKDTHTCRLAINNRLTNGKTSFTETGALTSKTGYTSQQVILFVRLFNLNVLKVTSMAKRSRSVNLIRVGESYRTSKRGKNHDEYLMM